MSTGRAITASVRPQPAPDPAIQIVALRTEERDAQSALDALRAFREPWGLFVAEVRAIVQEFEGQAWPILDPQWRPRVLMADTDRLALKAKVDEVFHPSGVPDPLGQLLRATFIQPGDGLYQVIGLREAPAAFSAVSSDRFEWAVRESEGFLDEQERKLTRMVGRARQQAEAFELQLADSRSHELELAERQDWSFKGLWKRATRGKVGKVATWATVTLLSGVLLDYGLPPLIRMVKAVIHWLPR